MFQVNIINTGSDGNCVVIDDHIMFDAGLTYKKVIDSGYDMNQLTDLFVSHKHGDHTNLPFIRRCIKEGKQVHIPEAIGQMIQEERIMDITQYLNVNVFYHQAHIQYTIEQDDQPQGTITLFPVRHYDIINYAFVYDKGDERLLYCTDLDTLDATDVSDGITSLGNFDTILLEGNYDEIWLRKYIQSGVSIIDPTGDASQFTDDELSKWIRANYRLLPKKLSQGLFRAVQNQRHLSKQQARLYVRQHLNTGGHYFEIHRSSKFYEEPSTWDDTLYWDNPKQNNPWD